MTERSVHHHSFTLERVYPAAAARVFRAFSDPVAKALWFAGPPDWDRGEKSMDFRVGGKEVDVGGPKGGPSIRMDCLYQDIVPDQRIVYSYSMDIGGKRISVSLATIALRPEGQGTRLILTEQAVYLDGLDKPENRIEGTEGLLDALGRSLET